jgi:hypothetical protein
MGGNLQHWSVGFRLRWLGDKGAMVKELVLWQKCEG